jgi:hypothetical protein
MEAGPGVIMLWRIRVILKGLKRGLGFHWSVPYIAREPLVGTLRHWWIQRDSFKNNTILKIVTLQLAALAQLVE